MKKPYEPKAIQELRKIRDAIHREAETVGFDRYYEALNHKSGWLLGKKVKHPVAIRERPTDYKSRKEA